VSGPTPPPYPGQQPPQPGWGPPQPPAYGHGNPQPYPAPVPDHPRSTLAMVLGIVAVAGGFTCYLPLLASPFAWVIGARAVREIDASGGRLGGRGQATAGKVLGIVGTVFLALALVAVIVLVVLSFTVDDFWSSDPTYD
jgi:uncharacterized membrane protein YphA (DoxX/SURF4 family)